MEAIVEIDSSAQEQATVINMNQGNTSTTGPREDTVPILDLPPSYCEAMMQESLVRNTVPIFLFDEP